MLALWMTAHEERGGGTRAVNESGGGGVYSEADEIKW